MQRNKKTFKGQRIFIGIDVHKRTWTYTVLTESSNFSKTVSHEASGAKLHEYLSKNFPEGDYLAVYESGFSGYSTYYELESLGIRCIIVNGADVPTKDSERQSKTDAVDSAKLARALKNGDLDAIYVMPRECIDSRGVVRTRMLFQRQLSGYKSRVKHLLHCNGVRMPERFAKNSTHWSGAFMKWLRDDVELLGTGRVSLDLLLSQVDGLRAAVLSATRKIREMSKTEEFRSNFMHLMTVPGIGELTAMTILTEMAEPGRFKSERAFTKYVGFVPATRDSGDHAPRCEMTDRGNAPLRCMYVEAAWRAVATDARFASAFGSYCQRMTKNEAIVRVARQLAHISLALIKNDKDYDADYDS